MRHFILIDVNEYYYNCGHYPEWVVTEVAEELPVVVPTTRRGTPLAYATKVEAEAVAARLNKVSREAWKAFLNG